MTWNGIYKHVLPDGAQRAPSDASVFFNYEIKRTSRGDNGLFTREPLQAGRILMVDGGTVLTSVEDIPEDFRYAVLIDEGLFLAPPNPFKLGPTWYINHSCSATIERIGGLVYLAKSDLPAGTELTADYAPFIAGVPRWEMNCHCGSEACRHKITGDDWRDSKVSKRLWREWLPFVQKWIVSVKN